MNDQHHQDHDHGHAEVRSRLIGCIEVGDGVHIEVEHVYDNDTCPEHGSLTTTGLVGITIHDETADAEQLASAMLDASQALLLADRITRAAHLVLELEEDLPDVEREYLRHSERQDGDQHAAQQAPEATAVVFACRLCWDEHFPGKEPPGRSHDARTCIIGADREAEFVSHGFRVVPGIVHGTSTPGLFCPHIDGNAG